MSLRSSACQSPTTCSNFPGDFESRSTGCRCRTSSSCRRAAVAESSVKLHRYSCSRYTVHTNSDCSDSMQEFELNFDLTSDSVDSFSSLTVLNSIHLSQRFHHHLMIATTTNESNYSSYSSRNSEVCRECRELRKNSTPAPSCCSCWWPHCKWCYGWRDLARWVDCCCCCVVAEYLLALHCRW